MSAPLFRYHLPKKSIKSDCPDCAPKYRRTLSRYIDRQTNEPLSEAFGRCDRESNCGYHLSPYHKGLSGMSYADELYERWKVSEKPNYVNSIPGYSDSAFTRQATRICSTVKAEEKDIHSIPDELFSQSLTHYDRNQFAKLLIQHFGVYEAHELLNRFQIGTSSRWPGACIFWYIDEVGRKRGGQIKLFDETFHTMKYTNSKGKKCSKTSWFHSSYSYRLDRQRQPYPAWLTAYIGQNEFSPCLFGLPQLLTESVDKPVAIVEAPKTAVLCTAYFPKVIWLAVGALAYLNAERLSPLRHRRIIAFPDASIKDKNSDYGKDYNNWYRRAEKLRNSEDGREPNFQIEVSDFLEQRVSEEDRRKGIDLADCLLNSWKGYPPDWDKASSDDSTTII